MHRDLALFFMQELLGICHGWIAPARLSFRNEWNEHAIRKSAVDSPGGIPDDLYDMPETLGMLNTVL